MSGHNHREHHKAMAEDFRRRFFISLLLTIPILVLSPTLQSLVGLEGIVDFPGRALVQFVFSAVVFFYGGWPFLTGLYDEVTGGKPGMMTLIGFAITVAFIYSSAVAFGLRGKVFFWELATLIDIMLIGHWIEMRSVLSAGEAMEKLAELMPEEAHRITEDGTEDVSVDELEKGDLVLVKPGERFPADGEIVEGESSVDESMVTGESKPVDKSEGDEVIGGSINGDASLKVKVTKLGEESFLSSIQESVQEAQGGRSQAQNLADQAAKWLTIIAISAGLITLGIWLLFTGESFAFGLERMVTVMVITCPHALGLAIPLVVAVYTGIGARNGFLIRDRNRFEEARNMDTVLFDKTGTLTTGEFTVDEVLTFGDMGQKELLSVAGAVETHSEHSIARAIADAAEDKPEAKNFKAIKGAGARAEVEGRTVELYSRKHIDSENYSYPEEQLDEMPGGNTLVFVVIEGNVEGVIALKDEIRESSRRAIERLREKGIEAGMITGDNEQAARRVAEELEIDTWFAEVMPEDKKSKVKELQDEGRRVIMVGDGVNDAPALAAADVGIAIGAGTDVAAETADIILVKNNPENIADLIDLSTKTRSKMWQNLAWATGYNLFAIPLAAGALFAWGIILSPAVGAALMSLSTVIVAINARFLKL